MINEKQISPFIVKLYTKLFKENFVIDKSGVKMVELLGISIKLNPNQPILNFGKKKSNEAYIKKELDWYLSQDLNVYPMMKDVKIWTEVADKDGYINSNYGWCIFSEANYSQYDFVLEELNRNRESRRACMIYNRPSMTIDYNYRGRSDYICTNYVQCFIRKGKLEYHIHQRSCDMVFGFFNDFAWHCYVYNRLVKDLNVSVGNILYIIDSFHVYERHFPILTEIHQYIQENLIKK